MSQLVEQFPRESAIAVQRSIEISSVLGSLLCFHGALSVWKFTPSGTSSGVGGGVLSPDVILWALLIARVVSLVSRPYFWFKARQNVKIARDLPTPQLVAQRLLEIRKPDSPSATLHRNLIYTWLACAFVGSGVAQWLGCEHAALPSEVRLHVYTNVVAMSFHKAACIAVFAFTMRNSAGAPARGIQKAALDSCTERVDFRPGCESCLRSLGGGDMDCSICLDSYASGDEIRKLGCKHHFHRRCLDGWLLEHNNRCPLCLSVVAPKQD